MTTLTITHNPSFKIWVWTVNKRNLWLSSAIVLAAFLLFKILYPYPDFLPESQSFIEAATKSTMINMRSIGYSVFLKAIGSNTYAHLLLVSLQYLALHVATFWFIFTICYLFKLEHITGQFIFGSLVFTPLYLYAANIVTNDALFAAGSICWITTLLWILYKPTRIALFTHGLLLALLLTIHNNAIYFPLISMMVVIASGINKSYKWTAIALILLLPTMYIGFAQYQYSKHTNTAQFSPMNGWQLASNALTAYTHVPANLRKTAPTQFTFMEKTANHFIDSMQQLRLLPSETLGAFYLSHSDSPLHTFMSKLNQSNKPSLANWALYGQFYRTYGLYLLKQYPAAYLQNFILPNLRNYYIPKIELARMYNKNATDNYTTTWFKLSPRNLATNQLTKKKKLVGCYSIMFTMINVLLTLSLLTMGGSYALNNKNFLIKKGFTIMIVFWVGNLLFSVITSPIVIRYQIAPLVTMFIFSLVTIYLIRKNTTQLNPITLNHNSLAKT